MMYVLCRALAIGLGFAALAGCDVTLQSNQYNFVKGLFQSQESLPEKNWKVNWDGRGYSVYAINHDAGTFFANEEGFFVSFDGWQITELKLPGAQGRKAVVVNKVVSDDGEVTLQFENSAGTALVRHKCAAWKRSIVAKNATEWLQQCNTDTGSYRNRILLNQVGELTALRFIVQPKAPPMLVELFM